MDQAASGLLATAFALAVIVPIDLWVFLDARAYDRRSRAVALDIGPLRIDRPAQWLAGCLVLFVVAVPAYLVARGAR